MFYFSFTPDCYDLKTYSVSFLHVSDIMHSDMKKNDDKATVFMNVHNICFYQTINILGV